MEGVLMDEQVLKIFMWIMSGWATLTFTVQIWNATQINTLRNLVSKITANDTGQSVQFESLKQQLEELRTQLEKLDETALKERQQIWEKIREIERVMIRCNNCNYNK